MKVLVYVLYHNDKTESRARKQFGKYAWVRLHRIQSTKYCESIIFPYLMLHPEEWKDQDYVGIITYSFTDKQKKSYLKNVINSIHANIMDQYVDVVGLRGLRARKTIYNTHPGIEPHMRSLLTQLGVGSTLPSNRISAFYNNYWIAKVGVFQNYLNFYDKAFKIMELMPELNQDSGYRRITNPAELMANFGYYHYTWHPFISERLICVFCAFYKLQVRVLI